MRHERQVLIEGWEQARLEDARVAIIGCGAIGSFLATKLARVGVGSMMFMDPDALEDHNLENQEYDARDVGRPKVVALQDRVRHIDPDIRVETAVARVQDFRGEIAAPFVFGCLDNVATRHFLNHLAITKSKILIDAGIDGFRGVVKTIVPGLTACQACQPFLPRTSSRASCSTNPIPSTSLTASVAAGLQAMQLVKLLHNWPFRSHLAFDLSRDTMHANDFTPNPDCVICGGA